MHTNENVAILFKETMLKMEPEEKSGSKKLGELQEEMGYVR